MKVVVFLLVMSLMQLVFGQAPGDFQEVCRTDFRYRTLHDWIPYVNDTTVGVRGDVKWQVLVDQNDYQHILGTGVGSSPVWMRRDIDGDGRQIGSSGTICTNSLQIRNTYRNPNSNNWVFTQLVSYLDAIEVIVNATVRFRGCQQRLSLNPPCQNNFVILHRYDTNSNRATSEITNTSNYQPCFGNVMNSRLEDISSSNTISVIRRFTRPNFDMTYFGIQDIGSYGDVQRLLVYYRVAQGYEEGLVKCPSIGLPHENSNDTVSKNCTCKENAIPMTKMQLTCQANGVCEGSPKCLCRAGYEGESDCQACPRGTYRSLDLTKCVPCPQLSNSCVAASYCRCVEGAYRAQWETIHADCTTTPSEPRSPTLKSSTNVSCSISWDSPSDNGGRNDTFYSITYMDTEEGCIFGNLHSINTNYVITNLKPATTYQIRITAENGVSANETSLNQTHARTATVTCTTKEGVPDKPFGVQVIHNLLIWQKPDTTNGVITGYEVYITFTPDHDPITRVLNSTRFYFIFKQNDLHENATAHVQVRAMTASTKGKWSDVISFIPQFGEKSVTTLCPAPPTLTCPPPPVCTTPEPPPTTTCPTPTEDITPVVFKLGGKTYENNTAVKSEDIGEGVNALLCVSNNAHCCVRHSSFRGEFYYPNGLTVPTSGRGHALYRNREPNFIRLNRRANLIISPSLLGRYRCDILDDAGVEQKLYINID